MPNMHNGSDEPEIVKYIVLTTIRGPEGECEHYRTPCAMQIVPATERISDPMPRRAQELHIKRMMLHSLVADGILDEHWERTGWIVQLDVLTEAEFSKRKSDNQRNN